MEKLKKLLKALGYDDAQIAELIADEPKFDHKKMLDHAKESMKTVLEGDEDFIAQFEEDARGKVLSSKERQLIKLGLITKEEYDKLPKEKRFDSALDLISKRVKEGGHSDDKAINEEMERLRKQVQDAAKEKETLEEQLTAKAGEVDNERAALTIDRFAMKHLAKKKLVLDPDDALALAMQDVRGTYDLKATAGGVQVFKKGTTVPATDEATAKKLGLDTLLDAFIERKKWGAKSNGTPEDKPIKNTARKTGEDEEDGTNSTKHKYRPPGMEAALKAAEEKKANLAKKRGTKEEVEA